MTATLLDTLRHRLGDRYAIDRQLGRGGMGAVFLGRDLQLDRSVAIKVLPAEFATQHDLRTRFLRETRTAASFSHPNIVPVFAVEERTDLVAMAMGLVEGESLAERVERAGPLTIREAVRLVEDVAYALAYAHGRGVVHRDIKPDNIMLERATGRALVMDFGISRTIAAAPATPGERDGLTRVGEVVGTPEYMSPEQASGDHVDGRSDLYSLALVAWYALTGSEAVAGTSTQQVLARQLTEVLPLVSAVRTDVPPVFAEALARCLEKDPVERFANAEAFVEAVDLVRSGGADVPTQIRLLAQELGTIGALTIGATAVSWFIWVLIVRAWQWSPSDALGQIMIVVAVVVARYVGAWRMAQRIRTLGYDVPDVIGAFRALMQEREASRAMLRADAVFVKKRQRLVRVAAVLLVASFVMGRFALSLRTQIGPTQWEVPRIAQVLLYTQSVILGGSLVVLLRSPLRMPIGERLFRWVWMGPLGRALLRRAGDEREGNTASALPRVPGLVTPVRAITAPRTAPGQTTARPGAVADLDARITALERWMADAERGAS